ncbi:MAG: CHRD domain-containing protein [Acidobacteriota bacterium]
MTRKLFVAVFALSCVIGWNGVPGFAQSGNTFKGRLAPVPAEAKTLPDIMGVGMASATLAGTKVTISGTFEGLASNATIAQLHDSKTIRGIRGPVIGDLTVTKAMKGTIGGNVNLTPEQVASLKAGRLYVQIHSEKAAEGNLWGWLLP